MAEPQRPSNLCTSSITYVFNLRLAQSLGMLDTVDASTTHGYLKELKALLKNKVKREKPLDAITYIQDYPALPADLQGQLGDAYASWYARAYVNNEEPMGSSFDSAGCLGVIVPLRNSAKELKLLPVAKPVAAPMQCGAGAGHPDNRVIHMLIEEARSGGAQSAMAWQMLSSYMQAQGSHGPSSSSGNEGIPGLRIFAQGKATATPPQKEVRNATHAAKPDTVVEDEKVKPGDGFIPCELPVLSPEEQAEMMRGAFQGREKGKRKLEDEGAPVKETSKKARSASTAKAKAKAKAAVPKSKAMKGKGKAVPKRKAKAKALPALCDGLRVEESGGGGSQPSGSAETGREAMHVPAVGAGADDAGGEEQPLHSVHVTNPSKPRRTYITACRCSGEPGTKHRQQLVAEWSYARFGERHKDLGTAAAQYIRDHKLGWTKAREIMSLDQFH